MKSKERISFTIDLEVVKKLKELREKECKNISKVVNNAIIQYLQEVQL